MRPLRQPARGSTRCEESRELEAPHWRSARDQCVKDPGQFAEECMADLCGCIPGGDFRVPAGNKGGGGGSRAHWPGDPFSCGLSRECFDRGWKNHSASSWFMGKFAGAAGFVTSEFIPRQLGCGMLCLPFDGSKSRIC